MGERQLNKILEALAVVEAAGDFPFSHLIATDGMRLNRNDTVLAISADPSPDWAKALQLIQRRGINSTAIIVDGSTFGSRADYVPLMAGLEASRHRHLSRRPVTCPSMRRWPIRSTRSTSPRTLTNSG